MAFRPVRKYPLDETADVGIGISMPFNEPAVIRPTYTTRDAIRNNLINFILTEPGEKIMNPLFGAGIYKYVFEQITTPDIEDIEAHIESVITQYFPTIQAEIKVTPYEDRNAVFITITYSIPDKGINDTIELNLNND